MRPQPHSPSTATHHAAPPCQALDAAEPSMKQLFQHPGYMNTILVPNNAAWDAALEKYGAWRTLWGLRGAVTGGVGRCAGCMAPSLANLSHHPQPWSRMQPLTARPPPHLTLARMQVAR